jgi:SAM-dependent methyltransferase
MPSLIERIHGAYVHSRRDRVLAQLLGDVLPRNARVLDVGAGDGLLARLIMDRRLDLTITGIDVLVRPETHIPIQLFDGKSIPYADRSFDVVLFVDVLHHTEDPIVLLREATRVAAHSVVIKDHTLNGFLAGPTLRFMDEVGNRRHGVVLPYNYLPRKTWDRAFELLRLQPTIWHSRLNLYPAIANWLFGRGLHFVARLEHKEPR